MNVQQSARECVEELIASRGSGQRPDLVGLVDDLLAVAAERGRLACCLSGPQLLRFQVGNEPPFEVPVGLAKSKLRAMCARLGTMLTERTGREASLFGDEGELPDAARRFRLRFTNTPSAQEFTLELLP